MFFCYCLPFEFFVDAQEEEISDLNGILERIAAENEEADKKMKESSNKIEAIQNQKEECQFHIVKLQKKIDGGAAERQAKLTEIQRLEKVWLIDN